MIWGKASAKGGQKVVEAASEELKELYRQIFIPITENLEGSGGLLSMQWLEPAREFRSLIANGESLDALLAVKRRFSAYLLPEENEDPKFRAIAWQSLLWAIWGQASENGGSKVIKSAPKELRERYQEIFQ